MYVCMYVAIQSKLIHYECVMQSLLHYLEHWRCS